MPQPGDARPPYAFIQFQDVKSAVACMEELEFRVSHELFFSSLSLSFKG